jgi:hypothetical protein
MKIFWIRKNDQTHIYLVGQKSYTTVALELEVNGGIYNIKEKATNAPTLFVDFPLVDSEKLFKFPCYI